MRLQVEADDTIRHSKVLRLRNRPLTGSNAGGSGHSGCGLNFGFDLLQA